MTDSAEGYDLLLKGGTVIDPAHGRRGRLDVAVKEGRVAAVARDLPVRGSAEVLDTSGLFVVPGLIDLHTHVYEGVSFLGIEADDLCPRTGVTTVVDTGSAGWINYKGLERYVIKRSETRIFGYVNLSGVGLPSRRGELVHHDYLDAGECAECVLRHPETALGVKVRLYEGVAGSMDLRDVLKSSVEAAEECGKPLMIHISGSDVTLEDLLPPLRTGDVVTHCCHGIGAASILDREGRIRPVVRDARERGILFDVGHGVGSFAFRIARRAVAEGFLPDTISTDIHTLCINYPVYDLPTTLSKFLGLGLSLDEVIERATIEPARIIGIDSHLGHLNVGATADIAVLDLEEGRFSFFDVEHEKMVGRQRLVCRATIKDGKVWWRAGEAGQTAGA